MHLTLRIWLTTGWLAIVLFPESRGQHALLGWLPFWLVVAPLLSLLLSTLRHGRPVRRQQARRLRARRSRMRFRAA